MNDKKQLVGSNPWNIKREATEWNEYNRNPDHSSNVSGIRLAVDTLGATTPVNTIGGNWLESGPRSAIGSDDEVERTFRHEDQGIRLVQDLTQRPVENLRYEVTRGSYFNDPAIHAGMSIGGEELADFDYSSTGVRLAKDINTKENT